MNKQCLNCGFIDKIETLTNGWGSMEKANQVCFKCGSSAYKKGYFDMHKKQTRPFNEDKDKQIEDLKKEFEDRLRGIIFVDGLAEEIFNFFEPYINSQVKQSNEDYLDGLKMERKSVAQLKFYMGDAYNDFGVQVAFKEGFNSAVDEFNTKLEQYKSKEREE